MVMKFTKEETEANFDHLLEKWRLEQEKVSLFRIFEKPKLDQKERMKKKVSLMDIINGKV